ncbi:MAG TPA: fructosamine kinase family protein, partial [Ohtaekwangia sp.]|uniref:fructosamine kinase family protein n=1 Tax=Ohtaekwangia sp. TaxID=2066019 RepID=UPI002F93B6D9
MNIPTAIQESVLKLLKLEPSAASIQSFTPASGGCINNGGKLSTSSGNYFLKWNSSMRFPGMFAAEARGLKLLRNSKSIYIPGVIGSGENGEYQFLLLEYIDQPSAFTKSHWIDFGNRLAQLHKTTSLLFGLDHNNYIGSLVQSNKTS